MKKFALLPTAVLAFSAACSDAPTAAVAPEAALFNVTMTPNTVNGPVWVNGEFTFTIERSGEGSGLVIPAGQNMHPQAPSAEGGTCRDANGNIGNTTSHTFWYNKQGRVQTSAKFCQGKGGGAAASEIVVITCTVNAIPATYASGTGWPVGGNEALNIDPTTSTLYDPDAELAALPDLFVHFRSKQNDTRGAGSIRAAYTCDNDVPAGNVQIDLTKFAASGGTGNNNLFINNMGENNAPVGRALTMVNNVLSLSANPVGFQNDLALTELSWVFRSRVGS